MKQKPFTKYPGFTACIPELFDHWATVAQPSTALIMSNPVLYDCKYKLDCVEGLPSCSFLPTATAVTIWNVIRSRDLENESYMDEESYPGFSVYIRGAILNPPVEKKRKHSNIGTDQAFHVIISLKVRKSLNIAWCRPLLAVNCSMCTAVICGRREFDCSMQLANVPW